MNYDDAGVTTAETSEQMSLGEEEFEVGSDGKCELCEVLLDHADLRKLGVPSGTEAVVIRCVKGVILVSPAQ
jgi:hypothetical protein